ncbi:hypothetical protein D0T57_09605 [Dysgonomonas sp. 511]|nr:hypothetical protein [Dysgonomonas sp. 511]
MLGKITKEDLNKEPYNEWLDREYTAYEPNKETIAELKKANKQGLSVQIFLGTWCGDSHREVPRMLKILEQAGFADDKIEIVGLNTGVGVSKQSPTGEEKGKYIFKVPTFIVSKGGKEVNRIVEFPVFSLEKDLATISSGGTYSPNYRSYPTIINWLETGVLSDKNISYNGLAEQIRPLVSNAVELTAVAYVLSYQGRKKEAATLCRIATRLFPETVRYNACAFIYNENGEKEAAIRALKKFIEKYNNREAIDAAFELYDEIKQRKAE